MNITVVARRGSCGRPAWSHIHRQNGYHRGRPAWLLLSPGVTSMVAWPPGVALGVARRVSECRFGVTLIVTQRDSDGLDFKEHGRL